VGTSVSLSAGEFAALMGFAIVFILVAVFVALFLSAVIAAGITRLLYVGGSWCVKRVRESYLQDDVARRMTGDINGTRATFVWHSNIRLENGTAKAANTPL
jgi:hypothetical protein